MRIGRKMLVPLLALLLLAAVGFAANARPAQGNSYANDPFCQRLLAAVPASKASSLVAFCDNRARALANGGLPRVAPQTPGPFPTVDVGGPVYGIWHASNDEPWDHGTYLFANSWNGSDNIVFAGALSSDPSQGVVVLTNRFVGPYPQILDVFQTPTKDGALTITAANSDVLTLAAADGALYTFDVANPGLVRQ
jgi:hypothetical protein